MLGLQRSTLKILIHLFGDWILERSGDRLFAHPGSVLFPKAIHELDPSESKCPDGNSVDYLLLALEKSESAAERLPPVGHPFERLLRMAQRETRWSMAVERLLLARLEGENP